MSIKTAHLEMIQGVINRLSQNSFLLKGWSVVLLSSLFALAALNTNPLFIYITYIPVFSFWALDAYFLRQERLFRKLYDTVRCKDEKDIDFAMDTTSVASEIGTLWSVVWSRTLAAFYGTLVLTVIVIMGVLVIKAA